MDRSGARIKMKNKTQLPCWRSYKTRASAKPAAPSSRINRSGRTRSVSTLPPKNETAARGREDYQAHCDEEQVVAPAGRRLAPEPSVPHEDLLVDRPEIDDNQAG